MGKQGPCLHCGISTTPLWRNGPPEKPVLCNACGSRWRTKGTLLHYMPMHSGGFGANSEASADMKWPRAKKNSHKHAEQRSHKRKEPCDGPVEREIGQYRADQSFSKGHEEDAASRSCSGSGISGSEGSVRRSSTSRGVQVLPPMVVEYPFTLIVPTKKRSFMSRQRTSFDKLRRSLTSLVLDPVSLSRPVPSSCSEALLVEYNKPSLVAVEIGLGSVFVRQQPVSIAQESESETSPFLMESKGSESLNVLGHNEVGGTSLVQGFNGIDKGSTIRGKDKARQGLRRPDGGRCNDKSVILNKALLENFPYNKRDVLQSSQSPLVFLEMKDIVNFDTFTGLLTEQEQGQLMQFVSSADLARIPDSLKFMFTSAQFEGALANFQHLLSEGMFHTSELFQNPVVLQHFQCLLTVTDLTCIGWMERCALLQNRNKRRGSVDCPKVMHNKESSKEKLKGISFSGGESMLLAGRSFEKVEEAKNGLAGTTSSALSTVLHSIKHEPTVKPEIGTTSSALPTVLHSIKHEPTVKPEIETFLHSPKHEPIVKPEIGMFSNDAVEMEPGAKIEGACFLSNSPFSSTVEYMDIGGIDSGDADSLLFEVPTPLTFQEAELLQEPSWSKTKSSMKEEDIDPSQVESGGLIMSNTWHMDPSPAEWGVFWNNSSCVGQGQVLPNGTVLNPSRILM